MLRTFVACTATLRRPQLFAAAPTLVSVQKNKMSTPSYSLNSLKRWSVLDKDLPPVEKITTLHVYDFDNTLFTTPLPNKQLWHGSAIGFLQRKETFSTGGWWHNANFLKCVGEGVEKEEPRGWKGWWNEEIVELVRLSSEQPDALNVLLTGRSESGFPDIVQKMTNSRNLEFDMSVFKPNIGPANQKFSSTMNFKQAFLEDLILTYKGATEIRLYEDREKHVQGFRDFFDDLDQKLKDPSATSRLRDPINSQVIEVPENSSNLDPIKECAEVQRMINTHNEAFRNGTLPHGGHSFEIKKTVFFTGYMLSPNDAERLLAATGLPSSKAAPEDMRIMANSILISPRPCTPYVLEKVGGLGKTLRWRATAIGHYENQVFAAKVEHVDSAEQIYTESSTPMIVLAIKGTGRPQDGNRIHQWQDLHPANIIEFDATVAEKMSLRIEQEQFRPENSDPSNKKPKLKDEEFPPLGQASNNRPSQQQNSSQRPGYQQRRQYWDDNRRPNGHGDGRRDMDGRREGDSRRSGDDRRGDRRPRGHGGYSGPRREYQQYRPMDSSGGGDSWSRRTRGGRGGGGYRSLDDQASRRGGRGYGMDGAGDEGLSY